MKQKKEAKAYSPLEEIRGALFHMIEVPFNGVPILCELKTLNQAEIMSVGNLGIFGHLEKGKPGGAPAEFTHEQKIQTLEIQDKIARLCMVNPTYDQFIETIFKEKDFIKNKREILNQIRADLEAAPETKMPTADRIMLREEVQKLEMQIDFLLPTDTAVFLLQWGLALDITPVKLLTEETLLEGAILAKRAGTAPHQYISGPFADYQRTHIDKEAWKLFDRALERQEKIKRGLKGKRK